MESNLLCVLESKKWWSVVNSERVVTEPQSPVHDKTRSRYVASKDTHLVAFASIVSCEFCNKAIVYIAAEWLGFLSLRRGLGVRDWTGAQTSDWGDC